MTVDQRIQSKSQGDEATPRSEESGARAYCHSRRHFLTGVAALGATALVSQAQTSSYAAARPFRIDTHHHFFPPQVARALSTPGQIVQTKTWSPGRAVEAMDQSGIAAAIMSQPAISEFRNDREEARKLVRECNEYGARMVRDYPGRFGLFASVPLFDAEGSLREVAYAFDVLKADGVCLVTSYADKWPGDPSFAPVFDELNRRRAVAFFHPIAPTCCSHLAVGIQPGALEYVFDTTRAIVSLMLSGTFSRCPDIRFLFSHGGGTLPALRERVDYVITEEQALTAKLPNGIGGELSKLYVDVVLVTNRANFALLTQLMPPGHLLLGTDFPFVPPPHTVNELAGLGLDTQLLRGIERNNALTLFPRFTM